MAISSTSSTTDRSGIPVSLIRESNADPPSEQVQALTTWNQLRQGDVWFALQDFSLALSTLRTGLEHYFKSIEGAAEDDESDLDLEQIEEDSEDEDQNDGTPVSAAFPTKPKGVDDGDWNIYRAIVATKEEFGEKYKKMWA